MINRRNANGVHECGMGEFSSRFSGRGVRGDQDPIPKLICLNIIKISKDWHLPFKIWRVKPPYFSCADGKHQFKTTFPFIRTTRPPLSKFWIRPQHCSMNTWVWCRRPVTPELYVCLQLWHSAFHPLFAMDLRHYRQSRQWKEDKSRMYTCSRLQQLIIVPTTRENEWNLL